MAGMWSLSTWVFVCCSLASLLLLRICFLLVIHFRSDEAKYQSRPKRLANTKVMIIAGSGGHTTEIIRLVQSLSNKYSPRIYIVADSDSMSEDKIRALENIKDHPPDDYFDIVKVPRSRKVGQSYITSIVTTLNALVYSVFQVTHYLPDLIICNGPGTCIPICIAAFLLRVLFIKNINIIFVESICRVKTMSLSGQILYYIADEVIVQWPDLVKKYPRARHFGRLV